MRTFTSIDYKRVKPVDRFLVVEVEPPEQKTSGGIFLPETVKDAHKFSEVVGRVVSLGSFAFHKNVNGEMQVEDIKVGDYVMFHPYAGDLHEASDRKPGDKSLDYRMLHDAAVVGRLFREGE